MEYRKHIIEPETCAEDRAWNQGVRDGYAQGLEWGDHDDPIFPPTPPFATEEETEAYGHGHNEGYWAATCSPKSGNA